MGIFIKRVSGFFYGRYGIDTLYYVLIVLYVIIIVAAWVVGLLCKKTLVGIIVYSVLYVVGLLLLFYIFFRVMSRNIPRRRRENEAFLRFVHKLSPRRRRKRPKDDAEHIFRYCKYCKALLRLPREPGQHQVRCPRCGKLFDLYVDPK